MLRLGPARDTQDKRETPAGATVYLSADGQAYLVGPVLLKGPIVESAAVNVQSGFATPDITLTKHGGEQFDRIAASNQRERLAIVVNGIVLSAPTINGGGFGGRLQISGGKFDVNEAKALAAALSSSYPPSTRVTPS